MYFNYGGVWICAQDFVHLIHSKTAQFEACKHQLDASHFCVRQRELQLAGYNMFQKQRIIELIPLKLLKQKKHTAIPKFWLTCSRKILYCLLVFWLVRLHFVSPMRE